MSRTLSRVNTVGNHSITVWNYNIVARIEHRAVTRLMCEVLEHLIQLLCDLVRVLKTSSDHTDTTDRSDREDWTRHHRQVALTHRAGTKMTRNLPDLLADLPVHYSENNPSMTLCNAQPHLVVETCSRNIHLARQTSSARRRRARCHCATTSSHNVVSEDSLLQPPRWENSNNYSHNNNYNNNCRSHHTGNSCSARIAGHMNSDFHQNIIPMYNSNSNNNNNTNRVDRLDLSNHDNVSNNKPQGCCWDRNGNQAVVESSSPNVSPSSEEDQADISMSPVQAVNRNQLSPTSTNNHNGGRVRSLCCHGNDSHLGCGQREENSVCPHRPGPEQCGLPSNAEQQGNRRPHLVLDHGENPDRNDGWPAGEESWGETHHEFTSELVLALRNIGDNLDTRLCHHDQRPVRAIIGSTKIHLGKLLMTALRHHNVVGVALGATLEMCLLFSRL